MPTSSAPEPAPHFVLSRAITLTVIMAAVFFFSAHYSAFWATVGRTSTPIFPGVGAGLAALLVAGRQYWPAILVGRMLAFWIAASDRDPLMMVAIASTNAATAWIGSWVVTRWGRLDLALSRLRDVLWLTLGGGVGASVIGATLGVSAMWIAGEVTTDRYVGTWFRWWMGSIGGVLSCTPLVLAWATGDRLPRTLRYWGPLLGSVAGVSVVSAWVFFGNSSELARSWLVFPVLLWSSLMFGVRGATLALLPPTILGVAGTTTGTGLLGVNFEPDVRYVLLQQFVAAASFTCLVLAVVADERRGERALRDREQRLHMALAAARSFGFDFEPATDRVTRTAECAEILGLPVEVAELGTGSDYRRLIHEEDIGIHDAAQRSLSRSSPTVSFVYRIRRPDGQIVHLEETSRAEFDRHGRITRIVGVTMDVTERRRAEMERENLLARERAARREAEHATLLRDEFLGTVSHELRTPLNAILGWAQILQSGPRTPEALQSGLATIARNARLQTQLIDDLLDLSRMSGGRLRIDAQPVDLGGVVRDAVLAVTPAASARQVHVHHEPPPSPVLVTGDSERLQQVFWNLLVNAVKFTEAGGKVGVQVDQADGFHRVCVSDTGQGIRPDFLPHVFDRFRQADGSTTRRHSGLGIGLALVRQLVELHGGSVHAASCGEGCGSTFTVHLPMLRAVPEATAAQEISSPSLVSAPDVAGPVKVLVVDDDADAREVASLFLQGAGARVITAASSDEALHLVRAERPDVVVADIGMPGTDGYAFIRAVRALPRDQGAETPAVALTALVRDEDRRHALEAGYHSHLSKPVTREALIGTVSRLHQLRHRA